MSTTTYWAPNQAAVAQVKTYTFTAPSGVGNHYIATINGKSVTYVSESGDTAALAATGLFNLLNVFTGIAAEFTEITWTNPEDGVLVATARTPGVPFADVPGTSAGLVLSTGNGLANGIASATTVVNTSPSDINDAQNWLRVDLGTTPPNKTRALPQSGDDVVLQDTAVPLLWNLDQLAAVQFNTYARLQSFTGSVGLPSRSTNGYTEWRATHFKFVGPQGSVPAGGLVMELGAGVGGGPALERYDTGSQKVTLTVLAGRQVDWLGVHTDSTFTLMGGVVLNVGMGTGEKANLSSSTVDGNATLNVGPEVTWTAASTLTMLGGSAQISAAPATLDLRNGARATFPTDGLTWAVITAQGGCTLTWLAGGTITTLTLSQGCVLDKSRDVRALTITNSTIDGDTCQIVDPLNAITFTNATSVKQRVTNGPFVFTGTRTVKVT